VTRESGEARSANPMHNHNIDLTLNDVAGATVYYIELTEHQILSDSLYGGGSRHRHTAVVKDGQFSVTQRTARLLHRELPVFYDCRFFEMPVITGISPSRHFTYKSFCPSPRTGMTGAG